MPSRRRELTPIYEALIDQFERYLMASGKAETTIPYYRFILRGYMSHVEDRGYNPFSRRAVESYLYVKRMEGCNTDTLRNRFYVLKSFFNGTEHGVEWTFRKSDVPPELPRKSKRKPVLDQKDMDKLEAVARIRGGKTTRAFHRLRNYAIIRLSDELGPRRIEITRIDFCDLHLTVEGEYPVERLASLTPDEMEWLKKYMFHPHVHLRTAKHGDPTVRELSPETVRALQAYIGTRFRTRKFKGKTKYGDEQAVFVNRYGKRITRNGLTQIHLALRKEAGITKDHAGFHAARRGRITSMWKAGVNREQIIDEWGWADSSSADNYIIPNEKETKKRIREAHPYFKEGGEA